MRMNRELAELQASVSGVVFPERPQWSFQTFEQKLLAVLKANDVEGDWTYDPYVGVFSTTWERTEALPATGERGDRTLMSLRRDADINPRLPLKDEIARVLWEHTAFNQQAAAIFAAARGTAG